MTDLSDFQNSMIAYIEFQCLDMYVWEFIDL